MPMNAMNARLARRLRNAVRPAGGALGIAAACSIAVDVAAAPACTARSGPTAAPLVELYTSEGCSSCPPADRWLSALERRPDVVALAFHVDYWDSLGWKDRFASPAHTQRQAQQRAVNGARFSYTPQVVIDGRDRKDWPRLSVDGARPPASVTITLSRDGERVTAEVVPGAAAPPELAGFWAVTESGHRTGVKAGENDGATLVHDFVVRDYQPLPAWAAMPGVPQRLVRASPPGTPSRKLNFVVVDAANGRPLQALALVC